MQIQTTKAYLIAQHSNSNNNNKQQLMRGQLLRLSDRQQVVVLW